MKLRAWISALRLRTLPLALSSTGLGSFLAVENGFFKVDIFIWAVLTTVFLQILSNLANDYGDTIHGADSEHRIGPQRAVQSGIISPKEMVWAVIISMILAFLAGIKLLSISVGIGTSLFYWFLLLGLLSILAAYTYTAGKRPYGYAGLGDIMVLIFFGLLGVGGSYFLYAQQFSLAILLPSLALGALATGVLNINNIRDIDADIKAGKNTIPVRFGKSKAIIYHWLLIIIAIVAGSTYLILIGIDKYSWIALTGIPLLVLNGYRVSNIKAHEKLDPLLKQLALSTFLFVVVFGLSIIL